MSTAAGDVGRFARLAEKAASAEAHEKILTQRDRHQSNMAVKILRSETGNHIP